MTIKDKLAHLSENSREQLLNSLGLEPKRETADLILPALGIFSAGLVVGAMLGVLFAPKSGSDLRHDFRQRFGHDHGLPGGPL